MNRATALTYLRIAGYHNDQTAFTRLYVENRVSYEAAKKAYREGQAQKARGVGCTCSECNPKGAN